MTFYSFIKCLPITDDPDGDFIKDTLVSSDFPKTKSKKKILFYLWKKNACKEAIETFEGLWDKYIEYLGAFKQHNDKFKNK